MMAKTFKLKEIERLTKLLSEQATFPIVDQKALIEALGGRAHKLQFHGTEHKVEEAEQIPDFYFPIASATDFFTKLADMRGMRNEVRDEEGLKEGKQITPPAGVSPPQVTPPTLSTGIVPSARGRRD
jgi:hypothetical protein